ncbi:MAG: hypothetical protein LUE20_07410 [Oscillospiraceae bacterium]|nr:hypothetical protein [Oscillospiraceae bacterium]
MTNNTEVMNKGITCLLESLGTVETEQFISLIIREQFDYTEWQKKRFDGVNARDFNAAAVTYAKNNPLRVNP